jgi:hypothetical protein
MLIFSTFLTKNTIYAEVQGRSELQLFEYKGFENYLNYHSQYDLIRIAKLSL